MTEKNHTHYRLYKPYGMLSQLTSNDAKEVRSKRFLGELYLFPKGIMPVGRLDEKSEGLLLMTTDGRISDTINQSGVEKEYFAQLDGEISAQAIAQLKSGVEIGLQGKKYLTKPCSVKRLEGISTLPSAYGGLRIGRHRPYSWISIILTEGKFRQVRKMTAAVGFPTIRLVRVRVGNITIADLTIGEVQPISSF